MNLFTSRILFVASLFATLMILPNPSHAYVYNDAQLLVVQEQNNNQQDSTIKSSEETTDTDAIQSEATSDSADSSTTDTDYSRYYRIPLLLLKLSVIPALIIFILLMKNRGYEYDLSFIRSKQFTILSAGFVLFVIFFFISLRNSREDANGDLLDLFWTIGLYLLSVVYVAYLNVKKSTPIFGIVFTIAQWITSIFGILMIIATAMFFSERHRKRYR